MKSKIKSFVCKAIQSYIRYMLYRNYSAQFKRYLKLHGFENKKATGEDAYIERWNVLCNRVEPYSYRFFSHYCGNTPNIVPEDIGRSYIEPVLNPPVFRPAYSDKNLFPLIIGKEHVPRTIICRINGSNLLDGDFNFADKDLNNYIGDSETLVLKPSVGTCSGKGVMLFHKCGSDFLSNDKSVVLSKKYLQAYGSNFCLQDGVQQHEFMYSLCSTSVNTIRICLYRSVKNEKSHVTASVVRIGKKGSFVDNVHAGGVRIGVNVKTGELGRFVVDTYGTIFDTWNNIDYSKSTFYVPYWHNIIAFAEYIGSRIHHHRLIALDIAIEKGGRPLLIEYNIESFSYSPYMCTGQEVFGEYTDEIIEYCSKKRNVTIDRIH